LAFTNNRFETIGEPDITIDITEVADIKLNALKAHRSQTEGMLKQMEEKLLNKDPEAMIWFEKEVYYTYKWND
jgi:LmbE family N-acetylglucosaminyl deacetylase